MGVESVGMHRMIHDAIAKCDSDIQHDLHRDITLSGGTTMFTGFEERLKNELENLSPKDAKVRPLTVYCSLSRLIRAYTRFE